MNKTGKTGAAAPAALRETLHIGIIQTTVDEKLAWSASSMPPFRMSRLESARAWDEILTAFHSFATVHPRPDIVLLPELGIPPGRIPGLRRLSASLGCLVIAGIDYSVDLKASEIRNQSILIVPSGWASGKPGRMTSSFSFGKTHPAPKEEFHFSQRGLRFVPDRTVWLFDSAAFGRFGVAICYDFLDAERLILYRGSVHHLMVIAHNKDIKLFYHQAESISRTVFCNTIICNTGHYGGSVAVSPVYNPDERTIYRHEGGDLYTAQVVQVPVAALDRAQRATPAADDRRFKNLPPGYHNRYIRP